MTQLNSIFFIINGILIGVLSFGGTPFIKLGTIFSIYIVFTVFHLFLLLMFSQISKKRLGLVLILFLFTSIAIFNTFIRGHYNPVSGWPALICFMIFSFYFFFKREFDQNSEKIIVVVIFGLAIHSLFLFFYIKDPILGLNEMGQNVLQVRLRDYWIENRNREDYATMFYNKNYIVKYFFWTLFFFFLFRIHKHKTDLMNFILLGSMIAITILMASGKYFVVSLISFSVYILYVMPNKNKVLNLFLISFFILFLISFCLLFFSDHIILKKIIDFVVSKFISIIDQGDYGGRLALILDGLKLIENNIFGSGLYFSREHLFTYTRTYSHNTFVETIIAIGPIFSIIFFICIFFYFKSFYKVLHIKLLFNAIIILSFFESIYFNFYLLPVVLCFISCYEIKNEYKNN